MTRTLFAVITAVALSACHNETPAQSTSNVTSSEAGGAGSETALTPLAPAPPVANVPPAASPQPMSMAMREAIPAQDAPVISAGAIHDPIARDAYQRAAEVPDRLAKLYCYCHCHENEGHRSLLTCFQTHHAEECGVCQREAMMAWTDARSGLSVDATQREADAIYNRGIAPPSIPE